MVPPYRPRIVDAELRELLGSLPAIAVEGPRAVGKTATALEHAKDGHYLDDPAQRELAAADLDRVLTGERPVLIDEWQYVPAIWDRVRRAVDVGAKPGSFLLTGSSSPRGTGTHSGGARIVRLRMRPLSLAERLDHVAPTVSLSHLLTGEQSPISGSTSVSLEEYTDEIIRSGFPGLRHLSGRALRTQLQGYVDRIVDRDFPELGHDLRKPDALRRWITAYGAATGTVTSFEKIRKAAASRDGETPAKTTVQPFRDVLDRLFILDPLPGWQPSRNHIAGLGIPEKNYLADPALAVRLLGLDKAALLRGEGPGGAPVVRDGTFLGSLFEALVALSVRVYAQACEATAWHLRTHRGTNEIDVIVRRGDDRVIALEVKLGATVDGSSIGHLNWLRKQIGDDLLDAAVITTGTEAYRRPDGIAVIPAALLGP